jgi:hypothetical protein
MTESRSRFIEEMNAEVERQCDQWGGLEHDDQHIRNDWIAFIAKQLGYASKEGISIDTFRERMVKIAALASAAAESQERLAGD